MSENEIKPAMSPEEWKQGETGDGQVFRTPRSWVSDPDALWVSDESHGSTRVKDRHATAALCLHGQPFGFTWEDVSLLRDEAASAADRDMGGMYRALNNLADRIAALLPPRETEGGA